MMSGYSSFDVFSRSEEGNDNSRHNEDESKEFKSKNLVAERKRRQKLSDRLLELRSLVPNITNMNKTTIITDAITYIEDLKSTVEDLSDQLDRIDATLTVDIESQKEGTIDAAKEMKKYGIETEVQVTHLNGTKVWIQIICQKKNGALTKLMEAINILGLCPQDTSVTTTKGALLVTSCVEANHGEFLEVAKIKDFLLETIKTI